MSTVGQQRKTMTRLMMSAATFAVGAVSYGREAYAQCVSTAPGTYHCSGTTSTSQELYSADSVTITTSGDFRVDSYNTALFASSDDVLNITTAEGSQLNSNINGIEAHGENGVNVNAFGDFNTTQTAIEVWGNNGTTVNATGDIDTDSSAIYAYSRSGNISVMSSGAITAGTNGVNAYGMGGDISVTTTGDVKAGSGTAVGAQTLDGSVAIDVTGELTGNRAIIGEGTGDVSIDFDGNFTASPFAGRTSAKILGESSHGNVLISVEGDVAASGGTAIRGQTEHGTVDIGFNGTIIGGNPGIIAVSDYGDVLIDANGAISGDAGINAWSTEGHVSITNNSSIQALNYGISAGSREGSISITNNASIQASGLGFSVQRGLAGMAPPDESPGPVLQLRADLVDEEPGGISIVNSGDIVMDGGNAGIAAINIDENGAPYLAIRNSGIISGAQYGIVALASNPYTRDGRVVVRTEASISADYTGILSSGGLAFGAPGMPSYGVNNSEVHVEVVGDDTLVKGGYFGISEGGVGAPTAPAGLASIRIGTGAEVQGGVASVYLQSDRAQILIEDGARATGDVVHDSIGGTGETQVTVRGTIDGDVFLEAGDDILAVNRVTSIIGSAFGGGGMDTLLIDTGMADAGTDAPVLSIAGRTFDLGAVDFDGDADGAAVSGFETFQVNAPQAIYLTGSNPETGSVELLGGTLVANAHAGNLSIFTNGRLSQATLSGTGTVGTVAGENLTVSPGELDETGRSPVSQIGTLSIEGDLVFIGGQTLQNQTDATTKTKLFTTNNFHIQVDDDGRGDLVNIAGSVDLTGAGLLVSAGSDARTFIGGEKVTIIKAGDGVSGSFAQTLVEIPDVDVTTIYNPYDVELDFTLAADQSDKSAAPSGSFAGAMSSLLFTTNLRANSLSSLPSESVSTIGAVNEIDAHTIPRVPVLTIFGDALGEEWDVTRRGAQSGYEADLQGGVAGVKYTAAFGSGVFVAGGAIGRTETATRVENGSSDVSGNHVGLFLGYADGPLRVAGSLGYADLGLSTFRDLGFANGIGETDGESVSSSFEISYDVAPRFGMESRRIAPYFGFENISAEFDDFEESGTTLAVDDIELDTQFVRAGVHLEQDFEVGDIAAVGQLSLGYEQVFGDRSATSINDVGVGGALIAETAEIGARRLLLGAGMRFGRGPVKGYVRYDGAFGHDSDKHSGTVGVSYQF